jgi:hypothetical protein
MLAGQFAKGVGREIFRKGSKNLVITFYLLNKEILKKLNLNYQMRSQVLL